jgi:hypothetical protein
VVEVDPRTRSALWGLIGVILGAGWVAFGLLGDGSRVFLTIMIVLSMVLAGIATFGLRSRRSA